MARQNATLTDLPAVFSTTIIREIAQTGRSAKLVRILDQCAFLERVDPHLTMGQLFDTVFAYLKVLGRRDEYIYRSAVTQKILLGRHSLRTASVLNEVRVGSSKADMVVFNGTSTAYELKSERDSLSRLAGQLSDYSRVYASVYVVTSPSQAPEVLATTSSDVGVLTLTRRFTLTTERAAVDDPFKLDPASMLDTMRNGEAVRLLHRLGVEVPEVPNTQMRSTLQHLVKQFDAKAVHSAMLDIMKASRSNSSSQLSLEHIPASLHAAVLALSLKQGALNNLRNVMAIPLQTALHWR
jgi:hypothetical protein